MNKLLEISIANDEAEVRQCWPVFHELRPHLPSEEEFVGRWRRQVENEGYQVIYLRDGDKVVAAAGYRFFHTMAWGHIMYVDDLVATKGSQRTGLGTLLLQHLQKEAKDHGCDSVHLDTGYHRHLAHRSYLRNRFQFHCHHMAWSVGE